MINNVEADLQVLRKLQRSAQASGTSVEESGPDQTSARKEDEVDLQQLAQKVFMLLKKELRVERERRGLS